jgi:HEAT repeat protein
VEEQLARWVEAINGPAFVDPSRRDRAVADMRAAGVDEVFPLLTERLRAADPDARCQAITALFFLDPHRAVEPVVAMLADLAVEVRWHACGCLHDFGDERAVPALCEALRRDPDPQVRGTAAYALGGIGSPAAIPALLAALGSDNESDELGHSPSSSAGTALDDILGTQETRLRMDGGLCRLAARPPDLDRLRCRAEELFSQWSGGRAEPRAAPDAGRR